MANEERINSAIGINALRFSAENVTLDCLRISSGVQFHSLRKMSLTALEIRGSAGHSDHHTSQAEGVTPAGDG